MMLHEGKIKKILMVSGCLVALILLVCSLSYFEYMTYTKAYNKKLNSVCCYIMETNPNMNPNALMEIINGKDEEKQNFFATYGVNLSQNSVLLGNERTMKIFLTINSATLVILGNVVIAGLFFSERKRHKDLDRITMYLKNINDGDYYYDINNSKEGNLSILESEVYKTTIMLKEAAENSKQDKERLKDSLSDISHQLKTPLTSLVINLDNLEHIPDLDAQTREKLLRNAKRDTNRITQMVQQLLTLSKLDANVIDFKKEEVTLFSIVAEAMENVEALAELKGISLVVENEADAQACVHCDKYWQSQAVTNILKNGLEHAKTQVRICYMNYELYKEIVVENDGEPISEADRKNLFKRFYSGENSSKDSVGIGLALANALVRQDGGYITVESDEQNGEMGVRFRIRYMK